MMGIIEKATLLVAKDGMRAIHQTPGRVLI